METERQFAHMGAFRNRMIACAEGQLKQALFPRRCVYCRDIVSPAGALICLLCEPKLPYIRGARCRKCGKELREAGQQPVQQRAEGGRGAAYRNGTCENAAPGMSASLCKSCAKHGRSFLLSLSLLNYDGISAEIMAGLKYHHKKEYADALAWLAFRNLGGTLRKLGTEALVPVPVHAKRRRQRGYNQAEELCRSLCAFMNCDEAALLRMGLSDEMLRRVRGICAKQVSADGRRAAGEITAGETAASRTSAGKMTAGKNAAAQMKTVNLLVRTKNTKAQKELGAAERLVNLQRAFSVPEGWNRTRGTKDRPRSLPHSVLLVDDIYTTGATMEACTQALLSAGVRRVYGLCICAGRDV